jgi:hypothetical protein
LCEYLNDYDNMVLLPNPQLILNSLSIEGSVGNQVNFPVTNAWTTGSTVLPHAKIIDIGGDDQADPINDFVPTSVQIGVTKKATGTLVANEDLEDATVSTVAGAVTTRLARAISQSTDIEGMKAIGFGSSYVANLANVNVGMDGVAAGAGVGACELAYVMSPEAMGYVVKRQPEVKMFEQVNRDHVEYVATLRNGFGQLRSNFIRAIATKEGIGGASNGANLDFFATSVANLRNVSAPTDGFGFYAGIVTPAQELALSKQLNGVGGISTGSIGSVAQEMGNDALLKATITQALGISFMRSSNTPGGLASS